MAPKQLTPEQLEVVQALQIWATDVSNNDWHQLNDSRPILVPVRQASDPANWNFMLEKVLQKARETGGEELAHTFAELIWKSHRKAWEAHERGTPDCLECAARSNIDLQNAVKFFASNP
jgi:hypothetical protein